MEKRAYVLKLETGTTLKLDDQGLSVEAVGAESKRLPDNKALEMLFGLASRMQLELVVQARKQAQESLLQLLRHHDWEGLTVLLEEYGDEIQQRTDLELERAARTNEPEEELSEEERLEQMEGMDQDDEEEDDVDMDN
ncbi:hypothetical protein [Paenibacillus pasadenensis]|nr:hypothetical protein [Paenibacillus pasadenensis]